MTTGDPVRLHKLDSLAKSASSLEAFIRGYERIDDPLIDTDDEILNWAFSETATDLAGAIWLLASGFYKASASSLRNAFDIAIASLYFQIRENTNPAERGYNRFFSEWDQGLRQTPNWGEMKVLIASQASVERFRSAHGIDMVEVIYNHFKYLCGYAHSSAFANNGDPITAINTTGVAPVFDVRYFDRCCGLTAKTISLTAIIWQVVFPQIAATGPLGPISSSAYANLFLPPYGPTALAHR